jgi:predicted nucleic acid-binding protein
MRRVGLKSSVLDSYAILAFLFKEQGYEKVVALLEKASQSESLVLIAAPNWAEVRYRVERKVGPPKWKETRGKLLGLPIEIVPVGIELAEMAGEIKAARKMSLADCFAAALAKHKNAQIYTGDPEFQAVEKEIKVIWI